MPVKGCLLNSFEVASTGLPLIVVRKDPIAS